MLRLPVTTEVILLVMTVIGIPAMDLQTVMERPLTQTAIPEIHEETPIIRPTIPQTVTTVTIPTAVTPTLHVTPEATIPVVQVVMALSAEAVSAEVVAEEVAVEVADNHLYCIQR